MPLHFILRDGVDIVVALPVSRLVAERLAALVAGRSGRLPLSITGLPRAVVFINHKARRRPGQRQPSRRLIGPTPSRWTQRHCPVRTTPVGSQSGHRVESGHLLTPTTGVAFGRPIWTATSRLHQRTPRASVPPDQANS